MSDAARIANVRPASQGVESDPKPVGGFLANARLEVFVAGPPDRQRARQQGLTLGGQRHAPAAAVGVVDVGGHQAPANQGLERRGERGAVGAEQGGDFGDAGRERAVEGVQQRELAAGQVQRAQRRIETAGQGAGGALGAQAKALVADEVGVGERVGG